MAADNQQTEKNVAILKGPGLACALLLGCAVILTGPALAADLNTLQHEGIKAFNEANFDQALDLFSQAVASKPDNALALYNQGTALYKLERFQEASQAFAASAAANPGSAARARAEYNQGRSLLAEAKTSQDLEPKKELLLDANQAFQQALRDNPRLLAARKGIEDFRQEYAKVQEQEKQAGQGQGQQPGQQEQGQGQQDLEQQLQEAGQQQQAMADQSKEAASQAQQGAGQEQGQGQEMAAQQQSVRQALEKIKDELANQQLDPGQAKQAKEELSKQLNEAIDQQKKAEEALGRGDVDQAQEHQQQAADRLQEMAADLAPDQQESKEQSAKAADAEASKDEEPEKTGAPGNQQQQENPDLTATKTDSTVADILDGEKALHEMRRLRAKQQRPASGKDW